LKFIDYNVAMTFILIIIIIISWLLGLFCICMYDCYHYVVNKDEYIS